MTAPALPGAAPDPARLPPEVDDAIVAAMKAATDFGVDGMLAHLQRTQDAVNALRTAIITAMRAACASSGAASDASSASARALGGDGEPVAWGLTDGKAGQVLEPLFTIVSAAEAAARRTGFLAVVPLYTRHAATGDTGDVEKARAAFYEAAREAQEIAVEAASQLPLSGEEQAAVAEARKKRSDAYRALVKAERATKGGPDAR